MAAPSWQDYFNLGKAESIDRRPELTFDEGDVSEMLVAGAAAMADHLTGYFAGRFRATFVDGASGDDLTVLADDHWSVQRFAPAAATGNVQFTRTTGNGAPSGTLSAGFIVATQKDSVTGKEIQYALDADLNWGSGVLGPLTASVSALIPGAASDSATSTVNRLISTPFDSTITVNNPTDAMAGGADAELDSSLRERVRNFPATVRRATLAALEFGALTVDGVAKASAVEPTDGLGNPLGYVNLYISDASGGSSAPLISSVKTTILQWRAGGVIVNVLGGSLLTQNVTLVLTARLGVNTQQLAANVTAAVRARVNKLNIGETLSPDIIKQAALNVDDAILSVNVTNPAVAVVPAANQLIQAGTVTVS